MTDGWTIGADVGAMLTGLSAVTAAYVWLQGRRRDWVAERATKRYRNWHGYIELGGISTWYVRVAEEPDSPSARVVLEVVDNKDQPDVNMAYNLRLRAEQDRQVARVPTPEEYSFLRDLHKERGYGKGTVVR